MGLFDRLLSRKSRKSEEAGRKKTDINDSALARAALHGQAEIVCALLDTGASINARTIVSGWTPLMAAASEGHTAVVEILLGRGADINAKDPGGATALMIAAGNGHIGTVQALLDQGADANHRRPDGVTALSAAAAFGKIRVVRLLLSKGVKDDGGALRAATRLGRNEIVNLLKEV